MLDPYGLMGMNLFLVFTVLVRSGVVTRMMAKMIIISSSQISGTGNEAGLIGSVYLKME